MPKYLVLKGRGEKKGFMRLRANKTQYTPIFCFIAVSSQTAVGHCEPNRAVLSEHYGQYLFLEARMKRFSLRSPQDIPRNILN